MHLTGSLGRCEGRLLRKPLRPAAGPAGVSLLATPAGGEAPVQNPAAQLLPQTLAAHGLAVCGILFQLGRVPPLAVRGIGGRCGKERWK